MAVVTPLSVRNLVVSTIKPCEKKTHPDTLHPSVFDVAAIDLYVPILFLYKPDQESRQSSLSEVVNHLKESLSRVLVPYYPFAGRWVRTYDARIRELQCTDEGVPFIEASIDEELESVVNLKDFVAVDLAGYSTVGLDPGAANQNSVLPLPASFVQVTGFKCGGVAVHVTLSHMVADGNGMLSFLKAWSDVALHGETAIVPSHDRSLTTSAADFLGLDAPIEPANHEDEHRNGTAALVDPGEAFICIKQKVGSRVTKTFHIKRKVIENLKREAAKKNVEVTTMDLITAHIWRSINNIPQGVDNKTSSIVGTWVDGRTRFHSPPLPEYYCGNVIVAAYTPQISATELSTSSILYAGSIVHSTVSSINPVSWQDAMKHAGQIIGDLKVNQSDKRQIWVSSWIRFPIYEIEFGSGLGKPIYAAPNYSSPLLPLGIMFILPPPPARSEDTIASIFTLFEEDNGAVQSLLADKEFLAFFH